MQIVIDMDDRVYKNLMTDNGWRAIELAKAIKNGTPLPKDATNGDVIKAMFPLEVWLQMKAREFNKTWWNAPYKAESVKP